MKSFKGFGTEVGGNSKSRTERLIAGLADLSPDWNLTPICRKKPYRAGWQSEQLDRDHLSKLLQFGDWQKGETGSYRVSPDGIALIVPEGHVAVDIDGTAARWLAGQLLNGGTNQFR